MMTILVALFAIILTLMLVVGTHETGHALAAACFGVKIERISIGFGKPLFKTTRPNGIEWVWARWPLGGYVKLLNHRTTPVPAQAYLHCFDKQSLWKRIIILISGGLANLITAWIAMVFMFMMGYQQVPAIIHTITPASIAAKAKLQAGDQIIAINHHNTPSWREVGMELITQIGQPKLTITIQDKHNQSYQKTLDITHWQTSKKTLFSSLGILIDSKKIHLEQIHGISWIKANQIAFYQMKYLVLFFINMLKQLLTGQLPLAFLLGPIGLFTAISTSFLHSLSAFAYLIGALSLAVAFVNLLPIPGLDGGLILYAFIEKIRGKPISIAFELLLYRLACIAFFVFFTQLILNDLKTFFS